MESCLPVFCMVFFFAACPVAEALNRADHGEKATPYTAISPPADAAPSQMLLGALSNKRNALMRRNSNEESSLVDTAERPLKLTHLGVSDALSVAKIDSDHGTSQRAPIEDSLPAAKIDKDHVASQRASLIALSGTVSTDVSAESAQAKVASIIAEERIVPLSEISSRLELDRMGRKRFEYYIGDFLANLTAPIHVKHKLSSDVDWNADNWSKVKYLTGIVATSVSLSQDRSHSGVIAEYASMFSYIPPGIGKDRPFIYSPEDGAWLVDYKYPTLVKPAPVPRDPDGKHVMMAWHRNRFADPVVKLATFDIPYEQKKDILIWRGTPTGPGYSSCSGQPINESRVMCVSRYGHANNAHIDIGFSSGGTLLSERVPPNHIGAMRTGDAISQKQYLEHKFILLVNGNDVASGTEWVIASNSVPFMTYPITRETWFLHSWLEPWKHFVPVRTDFSDLPEMVLWALGNPDKAKSIAMAGKQYAREFQSKPRENVVNAAVLAAYLNRVRIKLVPDASETLGTPVKAYAMGRRTNCGTGTSCCDVYDLSRHWI